MADVIGFSACAAALSALLIWVIAPGYRSAEFRRRLAAPIAVVAFFHAAAGLWDWAALALVLFEANAAAVRGPGA